MNKKVLDFIEKCEGWKTAIKTLHWNADNMSQHELCDNIAERLAEFQDQVSEVEQSITGNLKPSDFKPKKYTVKTLKGFVEDVLDATNTFYKSLEDEGDTYVGMRSDCESFLSDMQRNLYLVNFTMKEDIKRRLRASLNESMPKNIANHDIVDKFIGRKPKTMKARINQIYRIVKNYGIDSRVYHDNHWQAKDDYYKAITSLGCKFEMRPCGNSNDLDNWDSMTSDGGYTDYAEDGMPRSKQYAVKIMFEDGMNIGGYIKFMAAGTMEEPFSSYDTCMILWPKNNRKLALENRNMNNQIKLTEAELKQVVKEAAMKILAETPLNYDVDNFSGRWTKSDPSDEEWALANSYAEGESLDDPFNVPNSWDDDEWVDGDKDMENDYSWDLFNRSNNVGMSPIKHQHDIMDAAQNRRDHAAYWTDDDDERGSRLMNKWVNGKRDLDDLEDVDFSYNPYKYNESKEPMKVTESELKELVREAAMQIINEYGENVTNYVRATHGARRIKSGDPRKDREDRQKWLDSQMEKQRKKLEKVSSETNESIEIDPKNKGKFNATKKATGKSTEELTHSKNPLTRKRANFAKMAKRGWKPLKKSE